MRVLPVLLLLAVVALAGCSDAQRDPAPEAPFVTACPTPTTEDAVPGAHAPTPLPVREGFEAEAVESVSFMPRRATDGTWAAQEDPAAYEGSWVMVGQGDATPGFSALLFPAAGEPDDVVVEVAFRIGCVEHPHGVGVVLHVGDGGGSYQIVRYSASESVWDLFTVRNGERTKVDAARVGEGTDPEPGAWTRLRVTSTAGRIEAYDGATKVLDHMLDADQSRTGQVGLFLRGNSDAAFDAVRINVPDGPVA